MVKNIETVLERGEKIELLVEKTEVLEEHAFKFQKNSKTLKKKMWWKNVKVMCGLIWVLIAIIIVAFIVGCGGFQIPRCR